MKLIVLCIVFAVCIVLTHANGRGQYMGMYHWIGGRRCADDCGVLPPGNHPSCKGCDKYITCSNQRLFERSCLRGLEWDNRSKLCNWPKYSTCYDNNI